jgi:YegS/Rv2252/BmrU family lipid kinase
MTAKRTLVVVNPAAGSGAAMRRWSALRALARASFDFDEVQTTAPGHATSIARDAVSAGVERILAVGGDGTLHELVNALASTRVALGIIPAGTGNDFARSLRLPRSEAALLRGLAQGSERRVDLGQVLGVFYLNVAGVGFDADIARIVNAQTVKPRGTIPYLLTAVRHAFVYVPPALALRLDQEPTGVPAPRLLVAVGNASAYGGGMQICPGAVLDDGVLDVLIAGDLRRWATLALLPKVFLGRHLGHPAVRLVRAQEVAVTGPAGVAVHADGEIVGALPATFRVCPAALSLWMPHAPDRSRAS